MVFRDDGFGRKQYSLYSGLPPTRLEDVNCVEIWLIDADVTGRPPIIVHKQGSSS